MPQIKKLRKKILHNPEYYNKLYKGYVDENTTKLSKYLIEGFQNLNPRLPAGCVDEMKLYFINSYVCNGLNNNIDTNSLATYNRLLIEYFTYLTKTYNYIPTNLTKIDARSIGELLAITAVTGWKDQFELMARLSFKHLNDFIGDGFGVDFKWFMLLIAKDYLNAHIELESAYNPLKGGNINPLWRNIIANWREENADKFNQMMSDMADYHLSQSAYGSANKIYEFEDSNYWLFPIEILAVLRMREWANIANPPLTHPLFANSKLTSLQPTPPWPKDDMLDKVHEEFFKLYPDLPKIADLPKLRQEQN